MLQSSFSWRRKAFTWVAIGCVQFVILTVVAMLVYPGGSLVDPNSTRYSFFQNFFSDLGLTRSYTGGPNTASFLLFLVALTGAGAGLVLFFVAFRGFFAATLPGKVLSVLGTLAGIFSGLCFIGVAWAPADRLLRWHGQFVMWAFEALPIAVLLYVAAMLLQRSFPSRYLLVFLVHLLVLVGYLVLIFAGPNFATPQGVVAQATAQKVVVYASILSILAQSLGARRLVA